eukprot:gene7432-biopygen15084
MRAMGLVGPVRPVAPVAPVALVAPVAPVRPHPPVRSPKRTGPRCRSAVWGTGSTLVGTPSALKVLVGNGHRTRLQTRVRRL